MKLKHIYRIVCLLLVLAACSPTPKKPRAYGNPCEVWVKDSAGILAGMLSQPYGGLPQKEPAFDVRPLPDAWKEHVQRFARCLVIYDAATPLRMARNSYAQGQTIIYTNGQCDTLYIYRVLQAQQLAWQVAQLKHRHNEWAEALVDSAFGCSVLLPPDMQRSHCADNFLWLANQHPTQMRNICFFRLPTMQSLAVTIDSILQRNLPGEEEGMYLQVGRFLHKRTPAPGMRACCWYGEGRWEMVGDAMGGPAALAVYAMGKEYLGALVFVYAPGRAKRNDMVSLKAILQTVRMRV